MPLKCNFAYTLPLLQQNRDDRAARTSSSSGTHSRRGRKTARRTSLHRLLSPAGHLCPAQVNSKIPILIIVVFAGKIKPLCHPVRQIWRKATNRTKSGCVFCRNHEGSPAVSGAVFARITPSRSAGASWIWVPIFPPLTITVGWSSTLSSNTVTNCFFIPTGLHPPRT